LNGLSSTVDLNICMDTASAVHHSNNLF